MINIDYDTVQSYYCEKCLKGKFKKMNKIKKV